MYTDICDINQLQNFLNSTIHLLTWLLYLFARNVAFLCFFVAVAVVISTPKSIPYAALIADFFYLFIWNSFFAYSISRVFWNLYDLIFPIRIWCTKEKHFLFTGTFGSLVEFYTRKLNCISKVILHIFHFHSFSLRLATSYACQRNQKQQQFLW